MALIKPPPKKGGGTGANPPKPNPSGKSQSQVLGNSNKAQGGKAVLIGSSGKVTLSTGKAKVGGDIMAMMKGEAKEKEESESRAQLQDKIEEKVFAIPGMQDVVETEMFRDFIEKIATKIHLPTTSRQILKAFSNIDVTAEKVSETLRENPYYEYQFLKVIESMSKRAEMPSLEAAVILLGMQNSRNTIIALQLLRNVHGSHAEWTKDGKLKAPPNEVLRYALKTEDAVGGDKSGYSDTAYAAGVLFDFLAHTASVISKEPKKIAFYIDQVYAHGLKTAQISMELAKALPDFGFKKYLFAACLIHDIGKVVMATLDPEYLNFIEDCHKKELPRSLRYYVERRRFGLNHTVFGALCCNYFRIFQIIENAILFHHEPYFIKSSNKNLYQLAAMICLSTNIANHFKKVDKVDDPAIAIWKGQELKDLNIDTRQMLVAVSRVV